MHSILSLSLWLLFTVKYAYGCNGYNVTIDNLKSCNNKNNVLNVRNLNFVLNDQCKAIVSVCLRTNGFTAAQLTSTITKPPMPTMTDKSDLCSASNRNPIMTTILTVLNIPQKCPVSAQNVCRNKRKIDMTNVKSQLPLMLGSANVKMDVNHGSAGKTCYSFKITTTKV